METIITKSKEKKVKEIPKEDLSPKLLKVALQMRKPIAEGGEGLSCKRVAENMGLPESYIKDQLLGPSAKGGRPKKGEAVPQSVIKQTYIEVFTELKRKLREEMGDTPISNDVAVKKIGKEALHEATLKALNKAGWTIALRPLREKFSKLDFLKDIYEEVSLLPHEKKLTVMKEQKEWQNVEKDPMWKPRKGEERKDQVKDKLAYLYEKIAMRYGEWENIDSETVLNAEKLTQAYLDAPANAKPHCKIPKPIPFTKWTMEDVMWGLEYIDWMGQIGRYEYMSAFNRLVNSNPQLMLKESPLREFSKQTGFTTSTKKWKHTTFFKKFGKPEEVPEQAAQEPKTGEFKVVPEFGDMQKVFQMIRKMKIDTDAFNNLKDAKGKTISLSNDVKQTLAQDAILLALSIGAETGMRAGHKRQIETGYLKYGTSHYSVTNSELYCPTKMSEGEITTIETSPTLMEKIETYKAKLEKYKIDTKGLHIIPVDLTLVNKCFRQAAVDAGLVKYLTTYGVKLKTPGSRGKHYIKEFKKTDKEWGNSDYELPIIGFHNQRITESVDSADFHYHLLRAFHFTECLRNDIPIEIAIGLGSPWADIKIALECYGKRWSQQQKKGWKVKEGEIFKELGI